MYLLYILNDLKKRKKKTTPLFIIVIKMAYVCF